MSVPAVTLALACLCSVATASRTARNVKSLGRKHAVHGLGAHADGLEHEGGSTYGIRARRFASGTVILTNPGTYYLRENVVFEPTTTLTSGVSAADSHFPEPTSTKYPQTGGYFLGFFAAIAIAGDNITLDCLGNTIEMGFEFWRRQRFYAAIELGSKPFISGQGPPQFSVLSPGEPIIPNNVVIQNCILGLSSHHGIHGHSSQGVKIDNVQIRDFEVGGIHLNGASDVQITNVDVGPSLRQTYRAGFSHAIILDHLMNTLLPVSSFASELSVATVTLRGRTETVGSVFLRLHTALQQFYASRRGPLLNDAGNAMELPDGSAMYGITIHKTGDAVGDFGASCPFIEARDTGVLLSGTTLENVSVHDLALDVAQATRTLVDGRPVLGPAGDPFNWALAADANERYVGTVLSDAQLATGALQKHLLGIGSDAAAVRHYFGGTNIPDSILTWAASGTTSWSTAGSWVCYTDKMGHTNKGTIGVFLNYLQDGSFTNVSVSNLSNAGTIDASSARCVDAAYQGRDVYGVAIVNSRTLDTAGFSINKATFTAGSGGVVNRIVRKRT